MRREVSRSVFAKIEFSTESSGEAFQLFQLQIVSSSSSSSFYSLIIPPRIKGRDRGKPRPRGNGFNPRTGENRREKPRVANVIRISACTARCTWADELTKANKTRPIGRVSRSIGPVRVEKSGLFAPRCEKTGHPSLTLGEVRVGGRRSG